MQVDTLNPHMHHTPAVSAFETNNNIRQPFVSEFADGNLHLFFFLTWGACEIVLSQADVLFIPM